MSDGSASTAYPLILSENTIGLRHSATWSFLCCVQVFVTDKRKIKLYGRQEPPGRIRKALLAEVQLL